jgi:hypothetical protein
LFWSMAFLHTIQATPSISFLNLKNVILCALHFINSVPL